jgi:hypothetical protein
MIRKQIKKKDVQTIVDALEAIDVRYEIKRETVKVNEWISDKWTSVYKPAIFVYVYMDDMEVVE